MVINMFTKNLSTIFCSNKLIISKVIIILTMAFGLLNSYSALALVKLDITQGHIDPLPIAITFFHGNTNEEKIIGQNIANIIGNNLQNSGVFTLIDPAAFLEQLSISTKPEFSYWRKINATLIVVGEVIVNNDNTIQIQFRAWDPYNETQIEGLVLKINKQFWRRLAHKISDSIYKKVTGEEGYFDTKVLFVSESGKDPRKKMKRLAIMDQDGADVKFLTNGQYLVLTPRFDPKSQRALYVSYKNKIPQVFWIDLNTGMQGILGNFPGMSFAPRFSPDGNSVLISIAKDGTTSLYEVSLVTWKATRLISDIGAISTSPSYSPDGNKIVFNSDRSGSMQLYVMNRDGSDVKRISFGEGSYATPVWSPRYDFIAFTKILKGKFYIGVMRYDGSGERLLTTSWLEESPTWSPNGRVIMFCRQMIGEEPKLYAVDVTGYNEREVPTPGPASDPAWSPLLG